MKLREYGSMNNFWRLATIEFKEINRGVSMKKLRIVAVLLIILFGCTAKEAEPVSEEQVEISSDEIIEENSDNNNEEIIIDQVIDKNDSYFSDDDSIPCLIINDLRMRDAPNGNLVTIMDGLNHAPVKCYRVIETVKDDKYTWMKADFDDGIWFGTKPEWLQYITPNSDTNKYSVNERAEYVETGYFNAHNGKPLNMSQFSNSSYDEIKTLYPMDRETFELCQFLKKAIPGMCWTADSVVNFDARNPSEEARERITWQIFYYGPVVTKKGLHPMFNSGFDSYLTFKEHADYYTEKMYGNVINLQTVQYYDPDTQVYALFSFLDGHGSYVPFPIVLSQDREGEYITAKVALIEYEGSDKYNGSLYLVDNKAFKDLRGIDTKDYIENEARKCECVLKALDDGSYQLITVKVE